MKGQIFRICGLRHRALLPALLIGLCATQAAAQVSINVNIGAPPPLVVRSAPTMIYLAEPAVYTAVGIPYDLYFVDGRYFYLHNNNWFWAPGYGGPWTVVESRSLPPGLRKFKVVKLHEFRDREYKVYVADGRKFKGKNFTAAQGPGPKGRGRGHNK
jgi:hypothetical protein